MRSFNGILSGKDSSVLDPIRTTCLSVLFFHRIMTSLANPPLLSTAKIASKLVKITDI